MRIKRTSIIEVVAGALGGTLCIAGMQAASAGTHFPLMLIPFATSIVLVIGSPDAEPAQPRALVGGHLISTAVGLLAVHTAGSGPWVAAPAVGLAMAAMHVTRTFHLPAGIDPLVVVVAGMPWSFLLAPVAVGAAMLLAFGLVWTNLVRRLSGGAPWPKRWL